MRFSDRIVSGGEPHGPEGFESLSQLGIRTVVSVDGIRPNLEEAEAHGLRYIHIPIGYDGIPEQAGLSFARLIREATGPFFIHCHHGKHRGPAAAAVAFLAETSREGKQALPFLERVGTSRDYPGLWRDVEAYLPPPRGVDLPALVSVAEVGSLAAAMALIDRHFDHLKLLSESDWKPREDHPDLVPSQEAILVREAFHESLRNLSSQEPEKLREWLLEAESQALNLEEAIKSGGGQTATELFDAMSVSCKNCHKEFRN
jgi:protein tyrosine phosphatase (PTP) superfamily phosphohydrolase (DUF442 family)